MHIESRHKSLSPVVKSISMFIHAYRIWTQATVFSNEKKGVGGICNPKPNKMLKNSLARQTPLLITPVVQELDLSSIWSSNQTTKTYKLDIFSRTAVKFQNVHTCESQFLLSCDHNFFFFFISNIPDFFLFYDHNFFFFITNIPNQTPPQKRKKIYWGHSSSLRGG